MATNDTEIFISGTPLTHGFYGRSTTNITMLLTGGAVSSLSPGVITWNISSMLLLILVHQEMIEFIIHQNPYMTPFLLDNIFGVVGI